MKTTINTKDFMQKMAGLVDYTKGFLEGVDESTAILTKSIADEAVDSAYDFVDTVALAHSEKLHHVYEWGGVGQPESRLFKLDKLQVNKNYVQIVSSFKASVVATPNSNQVFAMKASVMEAGTPLIIQPKNSSVLAFDINGETIFTPNSVTVATPGGPGVAGGFDETMRQFNQYFMYKNKIKMAGRIKMAGIIFKSGLKRPSRDGGKNAGRRFIKGFIT